MEAIITTTITVPTATLMSTKPKKCRTSSSAMKLKLSQMSSLTPSLAPFTTAATTAKPCRGVVQVPRMEARDLAEQMKEMAAAQKRWEAQIREGKVKALTPKEAGYAIQLSDKILLDVRPSTERKKAWVKGSIWIPVFDVDRKLDPGIISKKISNFIMGNWWNGIPLMAYNDQFIKQVEEKITKDTDIIVACQKGIRSLAACEQLYKTGHRNLYWVQGGFDAAEEGDFEQDGPQLLKFAGIGGFSEFIGWTDQQRSASAKEGWGSRAMYFGRLVGVILLADALFLGVQQLIHKIQETNL